MVTANNKHDQQKVIVPVGVCPQCPEGGYDLISGARRDFLLKELNKALDLFQEKGELDELLNSLQNLVIKGLNISDLNNTVSVDGSDSLYIGCREIKNEGDETRIQITVVDDDKRYEVEVVRAQISPVKTFKMAGCPLIGSEEQPGCNPEVCPIAQQAKAKTVK